MITVVKYPDRKNWQELIKRPAFENTSLESSIKKILDKVKAKGDKAIFKYTKRFDKVKLKRLQVTEKEIKTADCFFPGNLRTSIQQAKSNIEKFHRSQIED